MKKNLLFLPFLFIIAGCIKKESVVNNYLNPQPAFAVNGITDLSFINGQDYLQSLQLTVTYLDSAQERVTLSLDNLPTGMNIDGNWVSSGIPTFTTSLNIADTNILPTGSYPVTLTATSASGSKKYYPFNINVLPMPTTFLGKYATCLTTCGGSGSYMDSLYADPTEADKVWFTNFANTGHQLYAIIGTEKLTIPSQTIGSSTYSGTISLIFSDHQIVSSIHVNTSNCTINMH